MCIYLLQNIGTPGGFEHWMTELVGSQAGAAESRVGGEGAKFNDTSNWICLEVMEKGFQGKDARPPQCPFKFCQLFSESHTHSLWPEPPTFTNMRKVLWSALK